MFGREDRGLTNPEIALCQSHITIDTSAEYPSLNLAHAVMLVCYEYRKACLKNGLLVQTIANPDLTPKRDAQMATIDEVAGMVEHIESVLVDMDYFKGQAEPSVMLRIKRLCMRLGLDQIEVGVVRGFMQAIQRHIDHK